MRPLVLPIAAALLLGGGVFVWYRSAASPGDAHHEAPPPLPRRAERPASPAPGRTTPADPSPVERPPEELNLIRERIFDLSTTYDPSAIPDLVAFLDDPAPEIRAEAREGLRQLGQQAAVPYLLKAAETAPTPEDAVALRELAAWLELPPARIER